MKKQLLTLVLTGVVLTGCAPSESEINDMIREMLPEERQQLQLAYDLNLLEGYDKGLSLADAHEYAGSFIPDRSQKEQAHYFTKRHAAYRLEQSRSTYIDPNSHHKPHKRTRIYTYYPDFPAKLRAQVQQTQTERIAGQNAWQTPFMPPRQKGDD